MVARPAGEGVDALSDRERETLRLLLAGHDIKSIAVYLGLSVHTVNERLRDARRKLGTASSRQAARLLAEAEQARPADSVRPNLSADKKSGVVGATTSAASEERPDRTSHRANRIAWVAGGLLVMSLIVVAAVVTVALQGAQDAPRQAPANIVSTAPSNSESAASAQSWLTLVDREQWDQSWSAAGTAFKSRISAKDWMSAAKPVREPLGSVSSRTLSSVVKATQLPGAPDGRYEVLTFTTAFEKKAGAIETVTLAQEPSGWKVVGYFIR